MNRVEAQELKIKNIHIIKKQVNTCLKQINVEIRKEQYKIFAELDRLRHVINEKNYEINNIKYKLIQANQANVELKTWSKWDEVAHRETTALLMESGIRS